MGSHIGLQLIHKLVIYRQSGQSIIIQFPVQLTLIAADPAFPMGLEELKASMDPSKYIGRSKEQVEAFLKNVISPILEANKDLLGVKAEINV